MATTTTLEIHPAIGIARVGSSQEFYLGPEPGLPIDRVRRDSTVDKLLKRQAARFRVYSCVRESDDTLVSFEELAPNKATITWSVHLINRKAAAPRFLDNSHVPNTNPALRRNGATGNDTSDAPLIIDGGAQAVTGPSQPKKFFKGKFKSLDVHLGEMSTDADGRVLVAGGFGKSLSLPPTSLDDFADNDNWHDDTSDGSVDAFVHFLDGRTDKAVDKPAWVIACQPDFAPGIGNLVTLYDAMVDLAIERGVLSMPTFKPAFDRDVLPLLKRATAYQWVNQFNRDAHGPGGIGDFNLMPGLGDPLSTTSARATIFALLRDPLSAGNPVGSPPMPFLFSDDYFSNRKLVLKLTRPQYRILQEWAANNFDAAGPAVPDQEPDALTRTVLEACVGGSFCPGIEAGRKLRDSTIFAPNEVFRFNHATLKPGRLSESMALPWQADFSACQWEDPTPPAPPRRGRGWWPAQRPDDVRTNPNSAAMVSWDRGANTMERMVNLWHQLGIVLETTDASGNKVFVEDQRTLP